MELLVGFGTPTLLDQQSRGGEMRVGLLSDGSDLGADLCGCAWIAPAERGPSWSVRARASSSRSTSRRRPTSVAPWTRSTPTLARALSTCQAATGCDFPFASTGSAWS
jgi:hypothetical protein